MVDSITVYTITSDLFDIAYIYLWLLILFDTQSKRSS